MKVIFVAKLIKNKFVLSCNMFSLVTFQYTSQQTNFSINSINSTESLHFYSWFNKERRTANNFFWWKFNKSYLYSLLTHSSSSTTLVPFLLFTPVVCRWLSDMRKNYYFYFIFIYLFFGSLSFFLLCFTYSSYKLSAPWSKYF